MVLRAALVLWVALAGCYNPNAATGAPCAANFACPGDQFCDRGHSPPICVAGAPNDAGPRDGTVVPDAFPDGGIGDAGMPLNVALVQQVTAKATTGATLTATLPAAPTDGDVLVMVGAGIQAQLAIVTGGGVTSWTKAAASTNNCNVEIWYGTSDGSSATISISYSSSVTDAPIWMQVSEWSGLSATGTLDNSTAASGTTGSANAGSLATHNATDLLIFAASDLTPNVFGTPTGGTWTAMTAISDGECAQSEWFRAVLTTGTYAQHVSQTGTGWDAAIAAFKIGP